MRTLLSEAGVHVADADAAASAPFHVFLGGDGSEPADFAQKRVDAIALWVPVGEGPVAGLDRLCTAPAAAVATFALGEPGARNAALFIIAALASAGDFGRREFLDSFRARQTQTVLGQTLPDLK